MKHILVVALALSLSACGIILPAQYNETEYRTLSEIATTVSLGTCDRTTSEKLVAQTTFLGHYTKHSGGITKNHHTHEAVVLIQEMVSDLHKRVESGQTISPTFCSMKLQIIGESIDSLKEASGGKVR